jgi:ribosomal protein S18 acetylase RimI-like enzyme
MAGPPPPFRAERYDLAYGSDEGFHLSAIEPHECDRLGEIFAGMPPWSHYPIPASALAALFRPGSDGGIRLAVRDGAGAPCGVMLLRHPWLAGPYLQFLGIEEAHQGMGLGSALIEWMIEEARRAGARNAWVAHSAGNAGAERLYRRHGFRLVAELDDLLQAGFDEVLMRLRLDRHSG